MRKAFERRRCLTVHAPGCNNRCSHVYVGVSRSTSPRRAGVLVFLFTRKCQVPCRAHTQTVTRALLMQDLSTASARTLEELAVLDETILDHLRDPRRLKRDGAEAIGG